MPKDSLEDIAGLNWDHVINEKTYKLSPIKMGDWVSLQGKLRALWLADAYKIDDDETQLAELDRVRKININRGDVMQAIGREEIANRFFAIVFVPSNLVSTQVTILLQSMDVNQQRDLMTDILNHSIPKPEKSEGEDTGNP